MQIGVILTEQYYMKVSKVDHYWLLFHQLKGNVLLTYSTKHIDILHNIIHIKYPWCPYCTHTHTRLTALSPGLPGWAGTRKVKPIWILLKQETVSGSAIRWAICKSALSSIQITTPAPHYSVFFRLDALPAAQPTASKHWRPLISIMQWDNIVLSENYLTLW